MTTEGKKCLLDNGAKQKLCPLLYDNNSEVKLNTIKVFISQCGDIDYVVLLIQALTMIAEVPTAREELKTDALHKVRRVQEIWPVHKYKA